VKGVVGDRVTVKGKGGRRCALMDAEGRLTSVKVGAGLIAQADVITLMKKMPLDVSSCN